MVVKRLSPGGGLEKGTVAIWHMVAACVCFFSGVFYKENCMVGGVTGYRVFYEERREEIKMRIEIIEEPGFVDTALKGSRFQEPCSYGE